MLVAFAPAFIIAVVVMAGCVHFGSQPQADSERVRWTNSPQPIEPEALRPPDAVGDAQINAQIKDQLWLQRAQRVRDDLIKRGISAGHI
jgi:hypothetical protein